MKPYLPSNETEGMIWTEMWCDRCSRRALDPGAKTQKEGVRWIGYANTLLLSV